VQDQRLKAAKILIVDDDQRSVHLLERMLRNAGYTHVTSTTDPRQALPLYLQVQADILLLALNMPFLDGTEVASQINRRVPDGQYLPIVLLLTEGGLIAKRDVPEGVADLWRKPLEGGEILCRVRNLLMLRFLSRELERLKGSVA
jgi:putative two-component system response regulator